MNKKILSLIVVVFMIFQTIASTAFAQSSAQSKVNKPRKLMASNS